MVTPPPATLEHGWTPSPSRIIRALWSAILCASAWGCAGSGRIATEEFIAVRVNAGTRTMAVLSESEQLVSRVDVYRIVQGEIVDIWPIERVSELPEVTRQSLHDCGVQFLWSLPESEDGRIDGLWPVGVDGTVLVEEWRGARELREAGLEGAYLVLRDGAGSVRWELRVFEMFLPEERGHFEYKHGFARESYYWLDEIGLLPATQELCVFAKGGHVRAIGIQDGKVRRILESRERGAGEE